MASHSEGRWQCGLAQGTPSRLHAAGRPQSSHCGPVLCSAVTRRILDGTTTPAPWKRTPTCRKVRAPGWFRLQESWHASRPRPTPRSRSPTIAPSPACTLCAGTEACASVTSAFLQVLATIHRVEASRSDRPRNVLQVRSRRPGVARLPGTLCLGAQRAAGTGNRPSCSAGGKADVCPDAEPCSRCGTFFSSTARQLSSLSCPLPHPPNRNRFCPPTRGAPR